MALDHVRDYVTLSDCYDLFNTRLFGGQLHGCVLTFEDRGQHCGYFRQDGRLGITPDPGSRTSSPVAGTVWRSVPPYLSQPGMGRQNGFDRAGAKPHRTALRSDDWPTNGRLPRGGRLIPRGGERDSRQAPLDHMIQRRGRHPPCSGIRGDVAGVGIPELVAVLPAELPEAGESEPVTTRPSKVGYQCPDCRMRVWGKPGLSVICGTCFDGGVVNRLEVPAMYFQNSRRWLGADHLSRGH